MLRALLASLAALLLATATPAQAPFTFLEKDRRAWARDLTSPDASARRSAAFALGKLGANADAELGKLLALVLKDPDAGVRAAAATAVGDIAFDLKAGAGLAMKDKNALPILTQALKNDADARVRRGAVYAIGAFGTAAAPALADVRGALHDRAAPAVRQNAAWALGRLGKDAPREAVEELANALQDQAPLVRRDAATALGEIGLPGAKPGVVKLIDLVGSEHQLGSNGDQVVLRTALETLVNLVGEEHRPKAGVIKPLVLDKDPVTGQVQDPDTQRLAALVLGNMGGPDAVAALAVLSRVLNDPDPRNQETAAAILGNLGKDAAPAVGELAEILVDPKRTPGTRRNAALALRAIGPDAARAVPALVAVLKDRNGNAEVRKYVAEALMQINYPANREAIPELIKVLRDRSDDLQVRLRALWAVRMVKPLTELGALEALEEALDEPGQQNKIIRYEAGHSLAKLLQTEATPRVVKPLLEMLEDPDLFIYKGASAKAQDVGGEKKGPESQAQEQRGGKGNFMAAEALGALQNGKALQDKGKRDDVIAALRKAANDPDEPLSKAAKQALKEIGADK
jgi:HEAT repeat protein